MTISEEKFVLEGNKTATYNLITLITLITSYLTVKNLAI